MGTPDRPSGHAKSPNAPYALFVDDTPKTIAAGDWPRTGYDNCNSNHSSNPGFTCQ